MPSIERRGANSFRLTVEIGRGPDGKRKRKRKTITIDDPALLKTKKKLQEYLEQEWYRFKTEVEAGAYIKPEKTTFKEFVDKHWWLKYARARGGLAPATQITYQEHLKTRILPHFGHMLLDEIKTMHLVDFFSDLQGHNARLDGKPGPLGDGTIRYIHRILRNIFSRAVEWKFIAANPMDGVKRPPKPEENIIVYTEEEMQQIIDALYHEPENWRLMILCTFLGGFRRGELVALELDDLDFENNTIRVDENIPKKVSGKFLIGPPKNKKTRHVQMPAWFMRELALYCREWKKHRLLIGDKWEGGDRKFLFHTGFGEPYHPNSVSAWWRRFTQKHGFRYVKLHGLRHTSATYLLQEGVQLESIQDRLGHVNKRSTEVYLHVTQKMVEQAAQKFDRFKRQVK